MFRLDDRLAADTVVLGRFPLSLLLLMNDARFPWCILVPRREGVTEIHRLGADDRAALLAESCRLAERMQAAFGADKMNVAALGNVVPQLHLHHVARFRGDAAWPHPVWGRGPAVPYAPEALAAARRTVAEGLGGGFEAAS